MRRIALLFLIFTFTAVRGVAQIALAQVVGPQPYLPKSNIIPVPNSTINYTHVMFEHPPVDKATMYQLQLTEETPKGALVAVTWDSSCATLWTGLAFGKTYRWLYRAENRKHKIIYESPEYTFTIAPLPIQNRVRVNVNKKGEHQGGLISFDYHTMIFDRDGNPVWFLPDDPKQEYSRNDRVRDIRVTSAGTITFITNRNAFEIMPDGRISWRAPKSGPNTVETLHHGIERLPNGNLMTLGNHTVRKAVPFDTLSIPVEFGVVVEYDRTGKIVWKWDSYSYIKPAEIEFQQLKNGQWTSSSHMNAFRQVSENGVEYVYVGFRDLSRIIKIEKSSGKVVGTYGRKLDSGFGWADEKLFYVQHDVTPLRDGSIAVFNNDSVTNEGVVSSLVIFTPGKQGQKSQVTYRLTCDFDKQTTGKSEKCGGVDELPNGNLLVNFGNINRTIEITRDGKIVWDAFTEYIPRDGIYSHDPDSMWKPAGQYRSHYSPSLYPCYYTAVLSENTSKQVSVSICNEGSETDQYKVEYKLSNGQWSLPVTSPLVKNYKYTTVAFSRSKTEKIPEIRVTSVANPDFIRTIRIPGKK